MHPAWGTIGFLGIGLAALAYYLGFRGKEVVIGIDLGTSFSVVAVKTEGKMEVIRHHKTGKFLVPSIVSFAKSGEAKVGDFAEDCPSRIYHAKRFIGRLAEEVSEDGTKHPFNIEADTNGFAAFRVDDKLVSPIEVGQLVVKELIDSVKAAIGYTVKSVVVCVPVSFRNLEREHTRKVFTSLGLSVTRLVEEPVAAALAYNIHKLTKESRRVMVFDLGGGTLDVTVLWVAVTGSITVLGSTGDGQLGGQDFDQLMLGLIQRQCPHGNINEAESAKIALTSVSVATVRTSDGCEMTVSNDEFESVSASLLGRITAEIELALDNQMMRPENVQDVVLVGGGSRMPIIRKLLSNIFKGTMAVFHSSLDPDTVVALGASNILD